MKTLRKIGMAILAVVLCVNFVACSDDDDDESNQVVNPLLGAWNYTSEEDGDGSFTFNENGSLVWYDGEETTSNHVYKLEGNVLKIIFNNNDDYTEGKIAFSGNKATYEYFWADCAGEWKDEELSHMVLTKK